VRLTALLPAVAALVLACEPGPGAGSRVDLLAHAVMTARVGDEARLRVAVLPTPESCSPQDLIASKALARLAEEEEQVAVLTVVPRGLPGDV